MGMADIFLKIETVPGESMDKNHPNEIEILGWSWGASQTGIAAFGSGLGAGKVEFQNLQVTHYVDKATPKFAFHCWGGNHIPEATLYQRKATGDGKQEDFLKITMTDLIVNSISESSSGELPTETATFNFSKVTLEYRAQKQDGSMDAWIKTGWDLKKNTKA